jgi:hypothetical protein
MLKCHGSNRQQLHQQSSPHACIAAVTTAAQQQSQQQQQQQWSGLCSGKLGFTMLMVTGHEQSCILLHCGVLINEPSPIAVVTD